jgi:hypothetical protein
LIKEAAVSNKKSRKERRFRSKPLAVVVAMIFVLVSLSAVLAACGGDGDEGNGGNGAATGLMAEERAGVEAGIKRYFERTGRTTIPPREFPKPISSWDTDSAFKGDLTVFMPTQFLYTWDANGQLTSVTEVSAD